MDVVWVLQTLDERAVALGKSFSIGAPPGRPPVLVRRRIGCHVNEGLAAREFGTFFPIGDSPAAWKRAKVYKVWLDTSARFLGLPGFNPGHE